MNQPVIGQRPAAGALLALLAMGLFSVQDALVKWLLEDYTLFQVMFLRSVTAIVPLLILIHVRYGRKALHTRRPFGHLLQVLFYFLAFVTYFIAIQRMPLADLSAITLSGPLFMTLFAVPVLGEVVGIRRWTALIVGFIGVIIMVNPGASEVDVLGVCLALGTAICYACMRIQTRRLVTTERGEVLVCYVTLGYLLLGAGVSIPSWETPTVFGLMCMLGLGLITMTAQYSVVKAYTLAPIAVLAPIDYSLLLWATLFGYAFWSETPSIHTLYGAPLVVGSGLYIVYRELKLRKLKETET